MIFAATDMINGCINLQGIECENNLLTNVDLTGLVNLMGVYYGNRFTRITIFSKHK